MYNQLKLDIGVLPHTGTLDDEGKNSYKFAEKYNRFYLEDQIPAINPQKELQKFRMLRPQTKISGFSPFKSNRGILVTEKTLAFLSDFHLAPHCIYEIPYEIIYEINTQWNSSHLSYYIFFYTSGFNHIDWESSSFYKHPQSNPKIVLEDNIQFNDASSFQQSYENAFYNGKLDLSPRKLTLQASLPKYDLFGMFFYESDLITSENLATLCKKKKFFDVYNKAVELPYVIHWNDL